jgi:hypothetical protein
MENLKKITYTFKLGIYFVQNNHFFPKTSL